MSNGVAMALTLAPQPLLHDNGTVLGGDGGASRRRALPSPSQPVL